jgi:hypothetical protein
MVGLPIARRSSRATGAYRVENVQLVIERTGVQSTGIPAGLSDDGFSTQLRHRPADQGVREPDIQRRTARAAVRPLR